ncbi:interleukin-17C [Heptranchias perlo]|uniref:interleukin-17C n=1 Tax=Heptranchias perlo TaxID=212740 RepID=UPI003559F23F
MGTGLKILSLFFLTLGLGQARRTKRSETHHCWYPEELETKGLQRLLGSARRPYFPSVTLIKELEQQQKLSDSCPDLRVHSSRKSDFSHRSISPWNYRIDEDENRIPRKLAFAQCLCDGCIDVETGEETLSLNSVPLEQTMMVIQRHSCHGQPRRYSLELKYIKVPVGCTCVLPNSSW